MKGALPAHVISRYASVMNTGSAVGQAKFVPSKPIPIPPARRGPSKHESQSPLNLTTHVTTAKGSSLNASVPQSYEAAWPESDPQEQASWLLQREILHKIAQIVVRSSAEWNERCKNAVAIVDQRDPADSVDAEHSVGSANVMVCSQVEIKSDANNANANANANANVDVYASGKPDQKTNKWFGLLTQEDANVRQTVASVLHDQQKSAAAQLCLTIDISLPHSNPSGKVAHPPGNGVRRSNVLLERWILISTRVNDATESGSRFGSSGTAYPTSSNVTNSGTPHTTASYNAGSTRLKNGTKKIGLSGYQRMGIVLRSIYSFLLLLPRHAWIQAQRRRLDKSQGMGQWKPTGPLFQTQMCATTSQTDSVFDDSPIHKSFAVSGNGVDLQCVVCYRSSIPEQIEASSDKLRVGIPAVNQGTTGSVIVSQSRILTARIDDDYFGCHRASSAHAHTDDGLRRMRLNSIHSSPDAVVTVPLSLSPSPSSDQVAHALRTTVEHLFVQQQIAPAATASVPSSSPAFGFGFGVASTSTIDPSLVSVPTSFTQTTPTPAAYRASSSLVAGALSLPTFLKPSTVVNALPLVQVSEKNTPVRNAAPRQRQVLALGDAHKNAIITPPDVPSPFLRSARPSTAMVSSISPSPLAFVDEGAWDGTGDTNACNDGVDAVAREARDGAYPSPVLRSSTGSESIMDNDASLGLFLDRLHHMPRLHLFTHNTPAGDDT